jgi:uncharacterized protein (TIGR04255 family)
MALQIDEGPRLIFETNPLKVVVAQVRFSPIFALEQAAGIAPFQDTIRDTYPLAEPRSQEISVAVGPTGIGSPIAQQGSWRFLSEDGKWVVAIAPNSLSLETTDYERFESFRARLEPLLDAASKTLRIGQRDRLGLRYINEISHPEAVTVSDWTRFIDSSLLGIAAGEMLKDQVIQALQQIHVKHEFCDLAIRHGYVRRSEDESAYILDLDAYDSEPEQFSAAAVVEKLNIFNKVIWTFFRRSISQDLIAFYRGKEEPR